MDKKKNNILMAAEALFIAAVTFLTCYLNLFGSVEKVVTDKFYQQKRGVNNKIKIIAIDDQTLRELGNMNRWSRQEYADVINFLGDNPAVIAMDIMIFNNNDEDGDNALREACRSSGSVVAVSYINFSSNPSASENGSIKNFDIDMVEYPIISDVCKTGFANALPDPDGVLRSTPMTLEYNGETLESLSYTTYKFYCEKNGIPINEPNLENGRMNIRYTEEPGKYEIVPLYKIKNGEISDPRVFKDCIVMIGAYATGLQDQFAVPNSSNLMFGVEIHANIIQALMDKKYPVSADRTLTSVLFGVLAGVSFVILRRLSMKGSVILMIVIASVYAGAAVLINSFGVILPLIYFPFYVIFSGVLSIVHSYFSESAEKRKISETFKKYVAPQVVDEITKAGGYTLKLGGESREIAVLFVDIRGFTPMSENLEPEQVVDILNSYLELTTNSIFNNGGTLDKFIGDATMAVFNAPFDLDDYVFRAVKTALDIVAGGDAIESKFLEKYGRSVGFGVGVNCGRAVVGNIGCSFRMDYTAIGDTVNTAARLEANAKRGQVLISQEVYDRVKDRVTVEPVGTIPLKGKSKEVFVYSLTGLVKNDD